MKQNPEVMGMVTLLIGGVLWLVMMGITLKNEFKVKKYKTYWIIALLVFPPSFILFPFIGMKQLK